MEGIKRGMRRFPIVAVIVAFGVGVIVGIILNRHSGPNFTEAQFDQIASGMTMRQVYLTMGIPEGDYRPVHWIRRFQFLSTMTVAASPLKEGGMPVAEIEALKEEDLDDWFQEGCPARNPKVTWDRWWSRSYGIEVAFDEKHLVLGHRLLKMEPPPEPRDFLGKLRWWWLNL